MTTEAVYQFMKTHNRPYNSNDISSNFPNEKSKAIQQALEKLKKEGKIFEKVYGKQKIYCATQDINRDASELARLNSELQAHASELEFKRKELDNDIKSREQKLEALKSGPTVEEAVKERDAIQSRIQQLETKLDHLMEICDNQPNLGEDKKKAEKLREQYSREYSKRKRMCTDILDSILEGFPGTKKQLYDDIGIEEKIIK